MTEEQKERRARRLLDDAISAAGEFAHRYDHPKVEHRAELLMLLCAVSLSGVIRHLGWWRAFRTLLGSVFVGAKYRGLVDVS